MQHKEILKRIRALLWQRFYANDDETFHSLLYKDVEAFEQFYNDWREEEFKKQKRKWSREFSFRNPHRTIFR